MLDEIPDDFGDVVMDFEASPEVMTRGTARRVQHMLLVAEPYFKSMETARRYHELSTGLGIPRVSIVGNKLRHGDDDILEEFCAAHDFELLTRIPFEPKFPEAERLGIAPFDHAPDAAGTLVIQEMARMIVGAHERA